MKRIRRLLPTAVLISLPFILVAALVYMFFWMIGSLGEAGCSWELTAHTWEDINSNGIQDSGEPPLENVAIPYWETRGSTTGAIPQVDGTDKAGQAAVLTPRFGHNCPDRVQVRAIAPEGYSPTTPDQRYITDKSMTTIGFGFRRLSGSKPPVRLEGTALCSAYRLEHVGYITGAALRPNGDVWLTSHTRGGVILRRDGTDYPQDIDGFGDYAFDIAVAPDGALWVAGGLRAGVARFDGTSWKTYTTANSALPSNDVMGIEVTRNGHVWGLTPVGLADFDPASERWQTMSDIGNAFSQPRYANIGMALLSSGDNVIWLLDGDTLTGFQSQSPRDTMRLIPVKLDSVSYVKMWKGAVAGDGSVWLIGEADGWPIVLRYNPRTDRWTNYTYFSTRGSLPLDYFHSIGILSDGSVLVGGQKWGAIRLMPDDNPANAEWTVYPSLVEYARKDGLVALTILGNDDVWFSNASPGDVLMCKLSQ